MAVSQKVKPVQTGFQQCLSINLGSPTSRPRTSPSYQIGGGLRLEIKCTINVMNLNHPKTTIPQVPLICGKTVFHETTSWCQKGQGPLLNQLPHDKYSRNTQLRCKLSGQHLLLHLAGHLQSRLPLPCSSLFYLIHLDEASETKGCSKSDNHGTLATYVQNFEYRKILHHLKTFKYMKKHSETILKEQKALS